MNSLNLDFGHSKYDIVFEKSFDNLPKQLEKINAQKKLLIVTETNVDKLYSDIVMNKLVSAGYICNKCVFDAGEENKTIDTIQKIYTSAINADLDRSSMIIALGGGVVGDMAGFVASTYMRGIRFVQIPTTLLSQVDSSIGGKTGFDFMGSKNIIGAFYQPSLVYININTLKTLDNLQFASGMAEVIKHSLISDRELFDFLINNHKNIANLDEDTLIDIVVCNCKIKSNVVLNDEKETGLRANLNFGHTIGHAIESAFDFRLPHGHCVSLGMVAVYYMAVKLNMVSEEELSKVKSILSLYNLPIACEDIGFDKVFLAMQKDKKKTSDGFKFIMPIKIGEVVQKTDIEKNTIILGYEQILNR